MKKLLFIIPLVALAASDRPNRHEVVVAWAYQTTYNITDGNGSRVQYAGAQIFCSSSSAGAPKLPQYGQGKPLVEIAEEAAQLLSQGYRLQWTADNLSFVATKQ